MKVVVTGGGTGGHVYPALTIIEELKKRVDSLEVLYIGTTTRMESKLIPSLGIEYVGIEMSGVNRKNIFANFKLPVLLIKNKMKLKKLYQEFKPDIVIGTGGYVTVPVINAAKSLKIPTLIFDADYNFGMATRYLKKRVDCVCTSYAKNRDGDKIIYTGNPRGQYLYENIDRSNIKNKALYVFGSLGSETVNDFFVNYFNNVKLDYEVKYVTGKGKYEDFVNKLQNNQVEVVEYIADMTKELGDVAFVVCRGGATSVSEFTACEIPAIYIPSPYVANNEQVYNVKELIDNSASLMIEESDLTIESFKLQEERMISEYDEIVKCLSKYSIKNSADLIIDNILRLVG